METPDDMKTVHQIWIGSDLPAREKAWVESVRSAASKAGWKHQLWTWTDLLAAYGNEPMAKLFIRLMADFPMPTTYTLMADYYRLRVLADKGGVYLDTDFSASAWPEFPAVADVYMLEEFFAPGRACNGFFYCRTPQAMRFAASVAEQHILTRLSLNDPNLPSLYIDMVRRDEGRGGLVHSGVGGGFLSRNVLPEWQARGLHAEFVSVEAVGHRQWRAASMLKHQSAAHWHEGGRGHDDPFWQAVVASAAEMTAKNRQLSRQQRLDSTPAHLRPCGGCLPPPPRVKPTAAEPTISHAPESAPPQFRVPRDVRRIVVLSNVTTGFSPNMLPLSAGDLVIHCNHARHREAAMAVKGTRHWLLVRHGKGRDPRGWHWYHDGTFDGFEKVFFVDDATLMQPFKWWSEFRSISKKSPTTGFIAANVMREVAPQLPLILAGFDPGVKHGTPQWDGHAWHVEAEWYKKRGFTLYRPRKQPRILLLVGSCLGYVGRDIRAKSPRQVYEQRRACRMAWLRRIAPDNIQVMMVVGRGASINEPLVRQIDAPDDFWHLPAKMQAAFKVALETSDFDWLVKADDDSFIHPERLVQYIATLPLGSRDVYGAPTSDGRKDRVCGGGGYILHRDTVVAIAADSAFPASGREDVEVCRAVMRHGGQVIQEPRFNATARPSPAPGNDIISCHHLSPAAMMRIHADCWKM